MVLRGTNSSLALVVFGFLWLAYDIYRIVAYIKKRKNLAEFPQLIADIQENEILAEPCTITLSRKSSFIGALNSYEYFLNGISMGKLKNGGSLSITTTYKKNVISCPEFPKNFTFEIQGNDPVKLRFRMIIDKDEQNVEIVSGAVKTDLIDDTKEKQSENVQNKVNQKKRANVPTIIISIIWMILIIICFVLSYDEYENRIHILPALLFLIMSTVLVLIGCVMIMIKQKKGIIIAFIGGIINILWSLIFNVFYYGSPGYGRFHTDEFILYFALVFLPGILLLPFILHKQKDNKEG